MQGTVSAFLDDFDSIASQMEVLLDTCDDLEEIVLNSLNLCRGLCWNLSLDKYMEIHSRCLSYLAFMKKVLSKGKFSEAALQKAFMKTLECTLVVPRLYVSLVIACSMSNQRNLQSVVAMLPGVSHPLRGILMRFTAISFFPKDSPQFLDFSVSNFSEILSMFPEFLSLYPDEIGLACGWLTANISMSLFLSNSNDEFIRKFFVAANGYNDERVSIEIVDSIVQSVDAQELPKLFPMVIEFINGVSVAENTRPIVASCCRLCNEPSAIFNFATRTPFVSELGIQVTDTAIRQKDISTVRNCATQWMHDDVHMRILKEMGTNLYASVIDTVPSEEVVKEFVRIADDETTGESLRKVLIGRMMQRSEDLEACLCEMIRRIKPQREFLASVFADPFVFIGKDLIQYVCAASLRCGVDFRLIIDFLDRTSGYDTSIMMISVYDRNYGDELVDRLINIEYEFARRYLIIRLSEFNVSSEKINMLFAQCRTEVEYREFCLLAHMRRDNDLLRRALNAWLCCDARCCTIKGQIDIYIGILNVLGTVCQSEDRTEEGFVSTLVDHVADVLRATSNRVFPVMTTEEAGSMRKILNYLKSLDSFAKIRENLEQLESLL